MAPRNKSLKCGSCEKLIHLKSDKLCCKGSCKKSFHLDCVSSDEIKSANELSWACNSCKSDKPNLAVNEHCQCFEHIQILTDQIFALTQNQSEIRSQLSALQAENIQLTNMLSSREKTDGARLAGKSDSYASVVKLNDQNMATFSPNKNDKEITHISEDNINDDKVLMPREVIGPTVGPRPTVVFNPLTASRTQVMKTQRQAQDEFTVVGKKGLTKRKRDSFNKLNKNKKQGITGCGNKQDKLSAVSKSKFLFVSRLAPDVKCDTIVDYLKEANSGEYIVTKLNNKYPGYSSFKVSVPAPLWDKVFTPEFWPVGAYVSPFWFSRRENKSVANGSFLEKGSSVVTNT